MIYTGEVTPAKFNGEMTEINSRVYQIDTRMPLKENVSQEDAIRTVLIEKAFKKGLLVASLVSVVADIENGYLFRVKAKCYPIKDNI